MKPLKGIVNIILLTMSVCLIAGGDHSHHWTRYPKLHYLHFFILFKTKYFLSVGKHAICKFSYWAVDFFSGSSNMDRSINSTCNKQTIASEISINNVSFVEPRNYFPPSGNVKRRRKTIKKQLYLRASQWKATVHVSKLLSIIIIYQLELAGQQINKACQKIHHFTQIVHSFWSCVPNYCNNLIVYTKNKMELLKQLIKSASHSHSHLNLNFQSL